MQKFNLYSWPGLYFQADDPGNGAASSTPDGEGNAGTPDQAALDKQFAERAKRAAETERKRIFANLGVDDEDSLKAIIEAKKQADDAAKTELDKMAEKATKAEGEAAKIKTEYEARIAAMATRVLNTEIKILAGRPVMDKDGKNVTRAAFRAEALDDVLVLIDRSAIEEEEGSFKNIEKALEALAKAKPYLLAEAPAAPGNGTPRPAPRKQDNGESKQDRTLIRSL